ncbi:MAG: hypothetical protein GXY85_00140 [Candidatus Brocadiaceae bacterium]|nr:hypothetical protein [Candidatus Brocadiaceae bacterium]
MASNSTTDGGAPCQAARLSRLELIKKRHRELILKPRESIAADFNDEFGDPFDDVLDGDPIEVPETMETMEAENY